jgi:hypothetical protein
MVILYCSMERVDNIQQNKVTSTVCIHRSRFINTTTSGYIFYLSFELHLERAKKNNFELFKLKTLSRFCRSSICSVMPPEVTAFLNLCIFNWPMTFSWSWVTAQSHFVKQLRRKRMKNTLKSEPTTWQNLIIFWQDYCCSGGPIVSPGIDPGFIVFPGQNNNVQCIVRICDNVKFLAVRRVSLMTLGKCCLTFHFRVTWSAVGWDPPPFFPYWTGIGQPI